MKNGEYLSNLHFTGGILLSKYGVKSQEIVKDPNPESNKVRLTMNVMTKAMLSFLVKVTIDIQTLESLEECAPRPVNRGAYHVKGIHHRI